MVMGQLSTKTQVVVIGGGPGGYTAAIRAAQLGKEVILVEKNKLGGTCTNVGCIPSKALIHAADVKYEAESEEAKTMGIETTIKFDFQKTQKWKDRVVEDLRSGISNLCKMNGVEVIYGQAFFESSDKLAVETETGIRTIEFENAIIATGTKVKEIDELKFDHKKILCSDDIFSLKTLPKRLIVVGGGYIAVEMTHLFLKLGCSVTTIHRGDRLLKKMEPEITDMLHKKIGELGGKILLNSKITKTTTLPPSTNIATISTPEGEKRFEFDAILVAAGREVCVDDLKLEKTGVKRNDEGLIIVDNTMKTDDPKIFAIGDIVPGPQLAHKAFREGKIAAEVIVGMKSAYDNLAMPMVIFSDPEIATAGMTEDEMRQKGIEPKIGKMPFSASGKARAINKTEGFVKIVADQKGVVRGVHIVGPGAGTLIAEGSLAIEMGALLEDLAATIHAHPTLPEALAEAAEDGLGNAIHLYRGKKR